MRLPIVDHDRVKCSSHRDMEQLHKGYEYRYGSRITVKQLRMKRERILLPKSLRTQRPNLITYA